MMAERTSKKKLNSDAKAVPIKKELNEDEEDNKEKLIAYLTSQEYKKHLRSRLNNHPYQCSSHEKHLESHKKEGTCSKSSKCSHKKVEEKPMYPCPACGVQFFTLLKRNSHIKTHVECSSILERNNKKQQSAVSTAQEEKKAQPLSNGDVPIHREWYTPISEGNATLSGPKKVPEFTCTSNTKDASVNTEPIPLMNNPENKPTDIFTLMDEVMKVPMTPAPGEVPAYERNEVKTFLKEIQSRIAIPLPNEEPVLVNPILAAKLIDNLTMPTLHFSNPVHLNWLMEFLKVLKYTRCPLKDATKEKIICLKSTIYQQLGEPIGILCVKKEFKCLVEAYRMVSEIEYCHFLGVHNMMF